MVDDKSKTGPADRTRINIHESYEVAYWTKQFGCTKAELEAAVGKVGVMVTNVRRHLGK
jgi:hypothetical protein